MSNVEDHAANIDGTVELREQQLYGKGLFAMLAKGLQLNVISSEFIRKYFQIDCILFMPQPEEYQQEDEQLQYEQHELLEPHLQQLLQQSQQQQQLFQQQFSLQQEQLCQEEYEQQLLLLQIPLHTQPSQRSPGRNRRRSI